MGNTESCVSNKLIVGQKGRLIYLIRSRNSSERAREYFSQWGETMIEKMTAYFAAEKQESLLFMAVGVLAVAIWLCANGHRLWQRHDIAAGVGAGLVLQAAFMLCLDLFAEARGGGYLAALRALAG